MEKDWAEDLGSKPKLCMLNSVCVHRFGGRCWNVRDKKHRRALMMLRGGTALSRLKRAVGKTYHENRDCAENVPLMRRWKIVTTGCYDALGGI